MGEAKREAQPSLCSHRKTMSAKVNLSKGIVRAVFPCGTTLHYEAIQLLTEGRKVFQALVAKHEAPRGLPRVDAAKFVTAMGIDTTSPRQPVLITEKQAGKLFLDLYVKQVETLDLSSASLEKLKSLSVPFTKDGVSITLVDPKQHLKDLLTKIWGGNLAEESPFGINLIQIGQRYRSGIASYILAEELIRANLGFTEENLEIRSFYKILGHLPIEWVKKRTGQQIIVER